MDNRLLPAGFDKRGLSKRSRGMGDLRGDVDFGGGDDVVECRIDTADYSGRFRASVQLLNQAIDFRW
jgi:hypothetical protein